MPKKKLYGAAAKAYAKAHRKKPKKHHAKRSKAKKHSKKHKVHHSKCARCGHKSHGAGGCMHVSGSKICPCS